jgi:hypothetical protein
VEEDAAVSGEGVVTVGFQFFFGIVSSQYCFAIGKAMTEINMAGNIFDLQNFRMNECTDRQRIMQGGSDTRSFCIAMCCGSMQAVFDQGCTQFGGACLALRQAWDVASRETIVRSMPLCRTISSASGSHHTLNSAACVSG